MPHSNASWNNSRLGSSLTRLGLEGAAFLACEEGLGLIAQLRGSIAPSLLRAARRHEYPFEIEEAINMLVVGLCAEGGRVALRAASCEEPLAYLAKVARDWARREWGHRAWEPYEEGQLLTIRVVPESGLSDLTEVIDRTFQILAPLTPRALCRELRHLLAWLAENPTHRTSYEHEILAAAHAEAPSFTAGQVRAVVSIAWGGRRGEAVHKRDSSLMYALLKEPAETFRPSNVPVLLRALVQYKATMRSRSALAALIR